ncbi:UNVERIFIED_CONTAM: hypothetical protein GTU68_045462 [Idotea baltica]|nr:hypothetical protein [Idotea baltica]
MECKKALTEAGGDMEAAIEQMRITGLAKADKKSGNTAAEGVVEIKIADDGKRFALVEINSQTDFAAKSEDFIGFVQSIAMHVAANNPHCVDETGVPAEMLEKEKSILMAEAAESGKPAEIIEKMVQGRIRKYLADITLVGQAFVKDPDQTVEKVLKSAGATVTAFHRLEVGEGIEKKVENFAEEVAAQVRGD